tara:strand:+ start:610 stop:759 length:150 start_codon:yes stop_codon:yes gene_type:complete
MCCQETPKDIINQKQKWNGYAPLCIRFNESPIKEDIVSLLRKKYGAKSQ